MRRIDYQRAAAVPVLLALAAVGCAQTPAQWKAGVAKTVITPSESIWMAGFGFRNHASEGVRQDFYLKALALQDGTGKTAVLVTVDLVDTHREIWDVVAQRCETRYGLSRDRILFNESHNHSGPVVTLQHSGYPMNEGGQDIVRRYTDKLLNQAVDTVGAAIANLAPATLQFSQSLAGIAVNRRRASNRALPGPVDHDVPVLAVRDPAGRLRAIVVGYACHATALMDYQISGDWPGYAQQDIEQAHPGTTALFVQGCGGDSNPLPRGTVELARLHGQMLAQAVEDALKGKLTSLSGPLRTAFERVEVPLQRPPTRAELTSAVENGTESERRRTQRWLTVLDREGKLADRYLYPVEVWQFGGGLKLIALGGETVVDHSLRLKGLFGWESTWVAGYSNDIFAYIPSQRVLKEGGYEGGDSMLGDFPRPFGAAIEEVIVQEVTDLVKATNPAPAAGPMRN